MRFRLWARSAALQGKLSPVVRENLVLTDSIGFLTSRNPCFRNDNADSGGYRTISQSGGFRVVPSGGRTANHRAPSATRYRLHSDTETSRHMFLNSLNEALSLRNGPVSKPMQGWNERADFTRTGRLHGVSRLFRIFADHGMRMARLRPSISPRWRTAWAIDPPCSW